MNNELSKTYSCEDLEKPLAFGRHKGKKLLYVIIMYSDYINWMLSTQNSFGFTGILKEFIRVVYSESNISARRVMANSIKDSYIKREIEHVDSLLKSQNDNQRRIDNAVSVKALLIEEERKYRADLRDDITQFISENYFYEATISGYLKWTRVKHGKSTAYKIISNTDCMNQVEVWSMPGIKPNKEGRKKPYFELRHKELPDDHFRGENVTNLALYLQHMLEEIDLIQNKKKKGEVVEKKIGNGDFIVKGNCSNCLKNHIVIDVEATVDVIDGKGQIRHLIFPAAYCSKCNVHFVDLESAKELSKHGRIMSKVILLKSFETGSYKHVFDNYDMNQESIIHILGYNVNKSVGLTDVQRRKILERAIDDKVITRMRVLYYLEGFISLARKKSDTTAMADAISKWQSDYEHIKDYSGKAGSMPIVPIETIRIPKKYWKNQKQD